MKSVHYLASASADLRAIADYYGALDPVVAARMLADIESAITYLQEYPYLGRPASRRKLRGKLTKGYRFKITYRVKRDAIEIVGIFRFQNREP